MMKIVQNNIIPTKNFQALTVWPFIFSRKALKDDAVNHATIHAMQQKEMLVILFFVWYGVEWLIRLIVHRNTFEAYRNISLEQEAYLREKDLTYLDERKHYAWVRYIFRKSFNDKRKGE